MDTEVNQSSKKINISASSVTIANDSSASRKLTYLNFLLKLVALKAELLSKQTEVQRAKSTTGLKSIKRGPLTKRDEPTVKKNKGVDSRAKLDEEEKEDERPSLDRVKTASEFIIPPPMFNCRFSQQSRLILEEKAKLYEKLSRDKNLLNEDTISEEQSVFLVDFQQKVVENTLKEITESRQSHRREPVVSDEDHGNEEDYQAQTEDDEWVDYVDSFGRTRSCRKADLAEFQRRDQKLNPDTYSNFVKASELPAAVGEESQELAAAEEERKKAQRTKWEAEEEENRNKSSVHYQDVLFQGKILHFAKFILLGFVSF